MPKEPSSSNCVKKYSPSTFEEDRYRCHYLPPFLPDEIFASIIFRACDHMGLRLRGEDACLKIRSGTTPYRRGTSLRFAGSLLALARGLPSSKTTPHNILQNHCLYAFLAPFSKPEHRYKHVRWALGGGPTTSKFGVWTSLKMPASFRLCPECVREDVKSFGEPYFHRVHQLSALKACVKHRVCLVDTSSDVRGFAPRSAREIVASADFPQRPKNSQLSKSLADYFSDGFAALANHIPFSLGNADFWKIYQRIFAFRLTTRKSVEALLQRIETAHQASLEEVFDWSTWSRPGIKNFLSTSLKTETLPLVGHFLLLHHMGIPFREGLRLARQTSLWACPNGYCLFYGKHQLTKPYRNKRSLRVTCPHCKIRFYFNINTPLGATPQVHRLIDPGTLLTAAVKRELGAGVSQRKVAAKAKIPVTIISRLAVEFGFKRNEVKKEHRYFPAIYKDKIDEYKSRILGWLAKHPKSTREEVMRALPSSYRNLRVEDPDWFKTHLPPKRKRKPSGKAATQSDQTAL